MIDDSLYAEQHRLAGLAVVDSRGLTDERDGYTSGDDWLRNSRDMLVKDGWDVKFDDKPEVLPATDPCNGVALYLGWYNGDATGPWVTPPSRFVPGAIAYHLHSFSAATVRNDKDHWVGPLIAHGVDATMGMVYEPYLSLTPHEDIFTRRLLQGDYFAEAAYASELRPVVDADRGRRSALSPVSSAASTRRWPKRARPTAAHDDWVLVAKSRARPAQRRNPKRCRQPETGAGSSRRRAGRRGSPGRSPGKSERRLPTPRTLTKRPSMRRPFPSIRFGSASSWPSVTAATATKCASKGSWNISGPITPTTRAASPSPTPWCPTCSYR